MSRSNPNDRPINPATRFFQWNGEKGYFHYYDKVKKEKVTCPLPFVFLVLDELTTIKGWSDADSSGIWANEVKDIKTGILSVRTKKGEQIAGTYENIKGKVSGADYCKSVYIAFKNEEKELVIGNIAIQGASLSSWIEFSKGINVQQGAIRVEDCIDGKKGSVSYKMPNFVQFTPSAETEAKAVDLDKKLQEYLKEYFNHKPTESVEEQVAEVVAEKVEPGLNAQASVNEFMNDGTQGLGGEKIVPVVTGASKGVAEAFGDDF